MAKNSASKKTMNRVLDVISNSNGVRKSEIARILDLSQSAIFAAVYQLLKLSCISEGAIKYFRIDGEITLKTGYFFEQDL